LNHQEFLVEIALLLMFQLKVWKILFLMIVKVLIQIKISY